MGTESTPIHFHVETSYIGPLASTDPQGFPQYSTVSSMTDGVTFHCAELQSDGDRAVVVWPCDGSRCGGPE